MESRFSRLTRFEEKKAYRRLFLTVIGTIVVLLSVVFLGVPALVKFSLFIGNLRGGGETITQDTTPPYPPHLEAPYTATNSASIAVSGYAEPGTTLEVFLNGESLKKILLGNDGQFSLADVPLIERENKITAQAKDAAGNISQPSDPLIITFKRTPPALEINEPPEGQGFSGNQREVQITGLTETGATVTVNGRLVMVKNDGTFTYSLPLNAGENLLKIVATDMASNQTTIERKVTFTP